MARRKEKIIEELDITDIAAEGKALGKHDGKVVFVPFTAPGDKVKVRVHRSKSSFAEATVLEYHNLSQLRVDPKCDYFGVCGGCKWQHLDYKEQLRYKEGQVRDQLERIGKLQIGEFRGVIGADHSLYYRNKLEYTFSFRRWLTSEEIQSGEQVENRKGLGFHIPGKFDKVLDVQTCHLMEMKHNELRNEVKAYGIEHDISFYNIYEFQGQLRNLVIRNSSFGEWMVIVIFGEELSKPLERLLEHLKQKFDWITSLQYIINEKKNDTYFDLPVQLFHGKEYITERIGELSYKIGPKSFFQTNTAQAKKLYDVVKELAGLTGNEVVYDLYTGTGTIASYVAADSAKVIGVDYIPESIEDANENAKMNGINNVDFVSGDMRHVLNQAFVSEHGLPDVVILDPPRAGMHEDVVKTLLAIKAKKIVYVSCNPATQARDLAMMAGNYSVDIAQPMDMFPHTHHVENVVLLTLKN